VVLLSLTKSILEKKRKRAVFHKLIITFYNEEVVLGAKRDRFRERGKESKKNDQKRRLFSLLPFFMSFFRAFLYFLTRQSVISRQSLPFLFLTNSKFSLHFAKRFSLRVHTTPRRERYLETQTL